MAITDALLGALKTTTGRVKGKLGNIFNIPSWEQAGAEVMSTPERVEKYIARGEIPIEWREETNKELAQKKLIAATEQNKSLPTNSPQGGGIGSGAGVEYTSQQLASLGISPNVWHGQIVTVGGNTYKVEDTGRGTRRLIPYSSSPSNPRSRQEIEQEIQGRDPYGMISEGEKQNIVSEYEGKAGDLIGAIEKAKREAAERRYAETLDILRGQKSEVSGLAQRQREERQKEKQLYEEQLKGKREEEVGDIEKSKQRAERTILEEKEGVSQNFRDLIQKFERVSRAAGVSVSGWTQGEERKLLQEFNSNLTKIALKHGDMLVDFNDAITKANRYFDDTEKELNFNTQKAINAIDEWERQQINAIQNQEKMALSDKYDEIANAVSQADQLRLSVLNNVTNMKAQMAQFAEQMKAYAYASAKQAASDNISGAKQSLSQIDQIFKIMNNAIQTGLGTIVRTPEGQSYFTAGGGLFNVPLSEEEEGSVGRMIEATPYTKLLQKPSVQDILVAGGQEAAQDYYQKLAELLRQ